MSDLISRKAVYDALECMRFASDAERQYGFSLLEQIPTAHPEYNVHDFPKDADCISRQQAIDALIKWYGCEPTDIGAFENIIEKLPSAQPEIIHCKDCKFAHMTYDGECKYCDIWFPDEKTYMDGDYFCASAEAKNVEND